MSSYKSDLTYLLACDIVSTATHIFDLTQRIKSYDQDAASWIENMAIRLSIHGRDIMQINNKETNRE